MTGPAADDHHPPAGEQAAQDMLHLTQLVLAAQTLAAGVTPTLEKLVRDTAAQGSAYFQLESRDLSYRVRAATGEMPATPGMQAIAAHGLPAETPLLQALAASRQPLFFDDTRSRHETAGLPELGVASVAAAPVRASDGRLLGAFLMHTLDPHCWQPTEVALLTLVSGTVAALSGRLAAEEDARQAREAALRALGLMLEARDGETHGHTDRVTRLALRAGQALGWDPDRLEALRWGAYLHDIGKIAIPDAVLLKPGRLTEEEWVTMRSHVEAGERFARALAFLPPLALNVIQDHHEHWSGQGYPAGKQAEGISVEGRLFALCDVYDALTSERPYKRAWTHEAAVAELRAQAGQQFDPELVEVVIRAAEDRGDALLA
ncbi:HD domain-containing phosphohydrolase [Deinococcus multiflagellatus]|uniref:HD domain-containing phosphohydrolase n=1 Tax=Deinococcus multiflagellatus TaxID=1656887 RepID=A0ABW1ZUE6_9DEIO|nr:HD domain-containing phosphohydrolase [Deinococcus multiflagellatus]MBZ9713516.1 HD domain-containing protein [Deinococcus multiflagellatus]